MYGTAYSFITNILYITLDMIQLNFLGLILINTAVIFLIPGLIQITSGNQIGLTGSVFMWSLIRGDRYIINSDIYKKNRSKCIPNVGKVHMSVRSDCL